MINDQQATEEKELPVLNEVVYRKILKWVVKKEQNRLLETKMTFSQAKEVDLCVQWPSVLQTNLDRLIHHTNVKLLENSTLSFDYCKLVDYRPRIRGENRHIPLRLFVEDWKTMKHFGKTVVPPADYMDYQGDFWTFASPVKAVRCCSTSHSCGCSVCVQHPPLSDEDLSDKPLIQTVEF